MLIRLLPVCWDEEALDCRLWVLWPGWHSSLSTPPDQHKLFCAQLFVRKLHGKCPASWLATECHDGS